MCKIKIFLKIMGLELLVIFFFTVNGAYVTLAAPSNAFFQYIGLLPLALGVYFYLLKTKEWKNYFSLTKLKPFKDTVFLCFPLLMVLTLLLIGNGWIQTSSISHIFLVLCTQILIVAFIEELFFRGFMLNILYSKGIKFAVLTSSVLFALTHSLQLLGGQSLEDTLLQVLYAFFIGMVLSMLIMIKQSIIVNIIFHGLNNSFIMMGQNNDSTIYNYLIISILIVQAIFLWFRLIKSHKFTSNKNIDVSI